MTGPLPGKVCIRESGYSNPLFMSKNVACANKLHRPAFMMLKRENFINFHAVTTTCHLTVILNIQYI